MSLAYTLISVYVLARHGYWEWLDRDRIYRDYIVTIWRVNVDAGDDWRRPEEVIVAHIGGAARQLCPPDLVGFL